MSFTIGFKPVPITDLTGLNFVDTSTGNETIESRTVQIIKPDLSDVSFSFPNNTDTTLVTTGFLDKDYALEAVFTVVTNANTYTTTLRFITLGYAIKARQARVKRAKIDKSILDLEQYKKNTVLIDYHSLSAQDRMAFSDIQGAQQELDFVADIIAKEALSPFSI